MILMGLQTIYLALRQECTSRHASIDRISDLMNQASPHEEHNVSRYGQKGLTSI